MDAKVRLAPPIVDATPLRPPWMNGAMAVAEDGWSGTLEGAPANGLSCMGRPDADLAEFPEGPSDEHIAAIIDELSRRLTGERPRRGPPPIRRR